MICSDSKLKVIAKSEVGMSQAVLRAGYNLAGLVAHWRGHDFLQREETQRKCEAVYSSIGAGDQMHAGRVFGTDPNPFELMFVKTNREKCAVVEHLTRLGMGDTSSPIRVGTAVGRSRDAPGPASPEAPSKAHPSFCIYTVVTGSYDPKVLYSPQHALITAGVDAYYVTDDPNIAHEASSRGWVVITIPATAQPRRTQRRLKILQHLAPELRVLKRYDFVLYHDGNNVPSEPRLLLELLQPYAMVGFRHPQRGRVADEIDAVERWELCSREQCGATRKMLVQFADDVGLADTRVLIRSTKNAPLDAALRGWFASMEMTGCMRDQVQFVPSLQKFDVPHILLPHDDMPFVELYDHHISSFAQQLPLGALDVRHMLRLFDQLVLQQMLTLNSVDHTTYVDKLLFKEYCAQRDVRTLKVLHVYNSPAEVSFETLPPSFVLKSNKAAGRNIIADSGRLVTPFQNESVNEALSKLQRFLLEWHLPYWNAMLEPQYERTTPRIYLEEFIGKAPPDIKVVVYRKKAIFVWVTTQFAGHKKTYYDTSFQRLPGQSAHTTPLFTEADIALNEETKVRIISTAERLAADVPLELVRVDLFIHNETVYAGEMTLTSNGGANIVNGF